ncbi:MAG: FAD-dependent oxidoreductase [Planctomycetota bacterium]
MIARYDIAVIGAGVAGAMSALLLGRRGHRVLLIDKARRGRNKVCGCCLNPRAIAELQAAGQDHVIDAAMPLYQAEVHAAGRTATLGLPAGVAVSRQRLDQALIQAAEQTGVTFRDQAVGRVEPNGVRVLRQGEAVRVRAGVVLVADGLAGSALSGHRDFARRVRPQSKRGYGAHLPAGRHDHPLERISMRCGRSGYLGAVVLEDGSLDIAAAIDPAAVKRAGGIAPAAQQIVDASGLPLPTRQGLDGLKWNATPPLTGRRPRRWSPGLPGVLLIGDSAGYIEPFTGEGMAWALSGARAVTGIVEPILSQGWSDRHGRAWDTAYRRHVARQQWRCRATAALLRRPRLTAGLVGLVAALPASLDSVVGHVLTPGRPVQQAFGGTP